METRMENIEYCTVAKWERKIQLKAETQLKEYKKKCFPANKGERKLSEFFYNENCLI